METRGWWSRASRPRRAAFIAATLTLLAVAVTTPILLSGGEDRGLGAVRIVTPSEGLDDILSGADASGEDPSSSPSPSASETDEPAATQPDPTPDAPTGGNGPSEQAAVSADGRIVAFSSFASNLVPDDDNGEGDIFVRDRETGRTFRVSLSTTGEQLNQHSAGPAISGDGRVVGFITEASNALPGGNPVFAAFVHDLETHKIRHLEVPGAATYLRLSNDGRYAAVQVEEVTKVWSIFVVDTVTGAATRASVSSSGEPADAASFIPSISAEGRYVAFESRAANLVPDDTNGASDVFVRDRTKGTTTRVSLTAGGTETDDDSGGPAISADGRHVSFFSMAPALDPGCATGAIFVRDLVTGGLSNVSGSSCPASGGSPSRDGSRIMFGAQGWEVLWTEGDGASNLVRRCGEADQSPSISADGGTVIVSNNCPYSLDDHNNVEDVYAYDVSARAFERVSVPDRA